MSDRIVNRVELNASVSRVWCAVTDYREFGRWFRVRLDGPFKEGAVSTGTMTYPGHEQDPWLATVVRLEPERLFTFRWHDFDPSSGLAIADQPTTLVEFQLEATSTGTLLTVTESGFEALSDHRRAEVMRGNAEGWNIQAKNIAAHVASES